MTDGQTFWMVVSGVCYVYAVLAIAVVSTDPEYQPKLRTIAFWLPSLVWCMLSPKVEEDDDTE